MVAEHHVQQVIVVVLLCIHCHHHVMSDPLLHASSLHSPELLTAPPTHESLSVPACAQSLAAAVRHRTPETRDESSKVFAVDDLPGRAVASVR